MSRQEDLPGESLECRTLRAFLDGCIRPAQYFRFRDLQQDGTAGVVAGEEYLTGEEAEEWRRGQLLGFMGWR